MSITAVGTFCTHSEDLAERVSLLAGEESSDFTLVWFLNHLNNQWSFYSSGGPKKDPAAILVVREAILLDSGDISSSPLPVR